MWSNSVNDFATLGTFNHSASIISLPKKGNILFISYISQQTYSSQKTLFCVSFSCLPPPITQPASILLTQSRPHIHFPHIRSLSLSLSLTASLTSRLYTCLQDGSLDTHLHPMHFFLCPSFSFWLFPRRNADEFVAETNKVPYPKLN